MLSPWPESYNGIKNKIYSEWKIKNEIEILREFSDGKSTARVFEVDIEGRNHRGLAILKLDTLLHKYKDYITESELFAQAIRSVPEYTKKHLPKLLDSFEFEDQIAILCTIAGDELNYLQSLSRLEMGQQLVALQQIAKDILEDWNKDYEITSSVCSPYDALNNWLKYRIQPSFGGRIHHFVENNCSLDSNEFSFNFLGEWFPNPCAYASNSNNWPLENKIKLAKGRTHGDLHGHYVLVRLKSPYEQTYYFIDLSFYENESYIFYDHAYIELSRLLYYRGNAQFNRWYKIIRALSKTIPLEVDFENCEPDDYGILCLINSVRQQISEWINRHEYARKDHIEAQAVLSRVAVGLNFVHKQISDNERKLAFLYSAINLRQYFNIFKLKLEHSGPVLNFTESIEAPTSDEWRKVWNLCDQFDSQKNIYLMVSSAEIRQINPEGLKILGRIPWAVVLDFDPDSKQGGLFEVVRPVLQMYRAPRETVIDNLQEINYKEATCWFMAAGLKTRDDTIPTNFREWRRRYIPIIRELATKLRKAISPQPVLVILFSKGLSTSHLKSTLEGLDEIFKDSARYVFLSDDKVDLEDISNEENIHVVKCDIKNFISGLWQMYGSSVKDVQIRIPHRDGFVFVSDIDFQYLKEDLEIVHQGLVEQAQKGIKVGHDFWRGHEITWTELDMSADVRRDISESLKKELIERLKESRNFLVNLQHTPGAGGTTLSKRIAWDLKELYPVVIITNFSPQTANRIERIFHLTALPVLVVIEASIVPTSAREQLYKDLKSRNVRAVFLFVIRSMSVLGKFSLEDPMSQQETNRFYEAYKNIALSDRITALVHLSKDEEMRRYRSPFFFGLFAFEKEFVHVPDFVKAHLNGINENAREIMKFLALITRFSQRYLDDAEIKRLNGMCVDQPLRLDIVLGNGPARLILYRDKKLRLIHTIIAEEVLKQLINWQTELANLSIKFIESLVEIDGADSNSVLEKFYDLFILREPWGISQERRRHFSDLIFNIESESGQHRVLKKLTECCPFEAHFWNHLGRHHLYVMKSSYEEAEKFLKKAIELDTDNDIHHHALGMVYRFEIRKRLDDYIRKCTSLEESFKNIQELVDKAETCFKKARELDPETEYGYITNIQMLIEIIARLKSLSESSDYIQFLASKNTISEWCTDKLTLAEDLLRRVKSLQAEGSSSVLTVKCSSEILNFYGKFDSMINSLTNLLNRVGVDRISVRRTMAAAYYARRDRDWNAMKNKDLHKIYNLMTENLEERPTNSRDIWMWFQSYRRLKEFDILEAIDRLSSWATREESIEAYYYLYILHFIRWRQRILDDPKVVRKFIQKCQELGGKMTRTRSFEWFAKEPFWCPLVHQSELGDWDHNINFYKNTNSLSYIDGIIKIIKGPQSGLIALGPFDVFFVPGNDFLQGRDENQNIRFYLGFSYEGFRAWKQERINS